MKKYSFIFFGLFSIFNLTANAQSNWQITEIASVPISTSSPNGKVCSAYDADVCQDISRFYQFNHSRLWRTTFVGNISENWGLRFTIVTGAKSLKMTVKPRLIVGVIAVKELGFRKSLSAEFYGSMRGETIHKPCTDSYDRQYYCGHLTAWSDYPDKTIISREYGIKLLYRF